MLAVVAGVSLAVLFASFVPLEWWSLGLLIFVSITIGQVLRLRANLIEVAISECERFYPAFQFVLWGGKSAEEAIAAAMLETQGEA